jgi:hypothetical protein
VIVTVAKSNGSTCRGRETDILPTQKARFAEEEKRYTPKFLLHQNKVFNLQNEREGELFLKVHDYISKIYKTKKIINPLSIHLTHVLSLIKNLSNLPNY